MQYNGTIESSNKVRHAQRIDARTTPARLPERRRTPPAATLPRALSVLPSAECLDDTAGGGRGGYPLLSSAPHGDAGRRLDTRHLEELEFLVSDAEEMLDGAEISSPDGLSLCQEMHAK